MSPAFVLPTLVAVVAVCAMGLIDWRLHPHTALPVFSTAMIVASAGFLAVVGSAAVGFALGPARSLALLEWCRVIPLHHQIHPGVGIVALAAAAAIAWRVVPVLRARHRAIRAVAPGARILIVDDVAPIAHAVPTNSGCVVVSTGLLSVLTPAERRAVFAHERAHLQLGHHRHVLLAELCVAALPPLRRLANQLRHATERAADEAAADHVSSRLIVARAISTVALASNLAPVPELGGGSIPRRVEALLWPEREQLAGTNLAAVATAVAALAGLALGVQLHHFGELLDHLCHSTS